MAYHARMDSPVHVRVCPGCGEEFRPEITVCSDCGAPLVDRFLDSSGRPLEEERGKVDVAPAPPPEGYAPLTVVASAVELRPMTSALEARGVAYQVRFAPDVHASRGGSAAGRFLVLVHEAERVPALMAIRPFLGHEAGRDATLVVETAFDAATGYLRCPACETALRKDAVECPECGLVVAGDGDAE